MKRFIWISGMLALVVALLLAGCGSASPASTPQKEVYYPSAVAVPTSGPPLAKFTVIGSGFAAGEQIKLSMTMLDGSVDWSFGGVDKKIITTKDGAFSASAQLPEGGLTTNRAYTIKVEGLTSGAKATTPFLVTAPPAKK